MSIDYVPVITYEDVMSRLDEPKSVRELMLEISGKTVFTIMEDSTYKQKIRRLLDKAVHQGYARKYGEKERKWVKL